MQMYCHQSQCLFLGALLLRGSMGSVTSKFSVFRVVALHAEQCNCFLGSRVVSVWRLNFATLSPSAAEMLDSWRVQLRFSLWRSNSSSMVTPRKKSKDFMQTETPVILLLISGSLMLSSDSSHSVCRKLQFVKIRWRVSAQTVHLVGRRMRIHQVIQNLLLASISSLMLVYVETFWSVSWFHTQYISKALPMTVHRLTVFETSKLRKCP